MSLEWGTGWTLAHSQFGVSEKRTERELGSLLIYVKYTLYTLHSSVAAPIFMSNQGAL